ncbi:AAA family ATPase [Ruminococcus sp. HUN007]|uniref:AAA family ATPase n=1 Tax=Ruminococcus sp. HUN007 TaxID=1514668 RepID=UPI0005D23188|nr:AAA family ATPase [Ruminococcus sp. HUN007]
MGTYINPGNSGFDEINDEDYVDKTMLISLVNSRICKKNKLICISRPRRFGKSYAAKMISAYYDCTCDSHRLFDDKKIAECDSYEKHLNQYNVINLDITWFISIAQRKGIALKEVPDQIADAVKEDLLAMDPNLPVDKGLEELLIAYVNKKGNKPFIFIIDEWDAMIREAKDDPEAQKRYLNLLRGWFKSNVFTPKVVAAAYMTGILPIKKDGSQSAISDFDEYPIIEPCDFAEFTGFLEEEVQQKCLARGLDYQEVKEWYDGYDFPNIGAIYNPYSVMKALEKKKCQSYWTQTSAAESLKSYINMNFDGLQETIARLVSGEDISVNVRSFQNDFETFNKADDVLTLLVHLGYLTYHADNKTVHIPNNEVREEFQQFISSQNEGKQWMKLIMRSKKLLDATLKEDADTVAEIMEEIRCENYAPQFYNNEQALRAIIKYAYICTEGSFAKIEEMPSGKGIADVVYIPKPMSNYPALVIELKWNKTAGGAIEQIKAKKYTAALKPFAGNIILAGINYDEKTGKHTCTIEKA